MWALLFFMTDFLAYALLNGWFVQSLLVFFILQQLLASSYTYSFKNFYLPLTLLVLQDCFMYGRFGLVLAYLLPLALLARHLRVVFLDAAGTLLCFLIGGLVFFDQFLIKKVLFSKNFSWEATLFKIFVNLCIAYLVLLGTRGNRSLLRFFSRERKVWTPNRKGASQGGVR